MKLSHAGALALVGWYLMMPPLKQHPTDLPTPDYQEPLSKRNPPIDTFDSAREYKEEVKLRVQQAELSGSENEKQ